MENNSLFENIGLFLVALAILALIVVLRWKIIQYAIYILIDKVLSVKQVVALDFLSFVLIKNKKGEGDS